MSTIAVKPNAPLHGLWRVLPSPALTEIFARGGMQFQIFDQEHGGYDYATLLPDILACERHGCAPLVRVGGRDSVEVQRCLDLGARGLVFPQLATPDDFVRAAAMMDYAPAGVRGFNPFVRAAGYGMAGADEAARSRPWFMPIVETLAAVAAIDEIVRLPRLDVVYVGVYDLSAQLGRPGDMRAPELQQVIARILTACHAAGKPVGMMALTPESAATLVAQGIKVLVHGVDGHRLQQAACDLVAPCAELKLPMGAPSPTLPL